MEKLVEKGVVESDGHKKIVMVTGDPNRWLGYVKVGAIAVQVALAVGRHLLLKG